MSETGKFYAACRRRDPGGPPDEALQNLTPYGDLVKKFKFLEEVKFLSNFVRANSYAQYEFASEEGGRRGAAAHVGNKKEAAILKRPLPRY